MKLGIVFAVVVLQTSVTFYGTLMCNGISALKE